MRHDCSYVRGIAVNSVTHAPFAGLRVTCVTFSDRQQVVLQEATTGGDGQFVLNLAAAATISADPGSGKYELHFWRDERELEMPIRSFPTS